MNTSPGSTLRATLFPRRSALLAAVCGILVAVAPAAATAAPPSAKTDAASGVTASSATLNGTVNSGGEAATYVFEYGPTVAYGSATPTGSVPAAKGNQSVSATVTGLAPSTTYHFRLTTRMASGTATGDDLTFTTSAVGPPPPAPAPGSGITAVDLAGATTITYGAAARLTGTVKAKGKTDVTKILVYLQRADPPFTVFRDIAGGPHTPLADGTFAFAVKPVRNALYRAVVRQSTGDVLSPNQLVRVRLRVGLGVSDLTPKRGTLVTFAGNVNPGHAGRTVQIQRRTATGTWNTVARATLRALRPTRSTFRRAIRIFRSGTFRVRAAHPADHVANVSRVRRLVTHR